MLLAAGTRLGPYEILEPLGAGGMGEVYRAQDPRLSRTVAIKILPAHFSENEEARERFEREAKAIAALSHPHILSIFDFGCGEGILYAVTELLQGETLRERMSGGPMSWREAVEIGIEIAEGLSSAHARGIIHRDIKPENIFITTEGHVKILDFGLARWEPSKRSGIMRLAQQELTEAGALVGTYPYMSPEQVQGSPLTGASDLFSLGCMLYEMVSGYRPFLRDTAADTLIAILQ
ncbi:MAG TPA: serine/threonine-protein kinase, partial [Acidobacteriota bacterium]|nr:serine/threonine-protein kinase [Acidobacteriota bacterium]